MAERKYNTKQRDIIIECLKQNSDCHMSADDIYLLLQKGGKNVGRTTVYRHLDALCDEGKLLKYTVGEKSPCCFQLKSDSCSRHYHLVCEKCGKLFHTQCTEVDEFLRHFEKHHNFTVDMTKTTLYGICDKCKKEES